MRFLGHLDLTRMLLRTLRRAGVPLVYSQGFNPKPKVSFGPALSLGVVSEAEYMDFESWDALRGRRACAGACRLVTPAGADLRYAVRRLNNGTPKLGETIRAARYRVQARPDRRGARASSDLAMRPRRSPSSVWPRAARFGRSTSTREIEAVEPDGSDSLRFTLAIHHDGASIRPEEALRGLFGKSAAGARVVREDLLVEWNGRRVNPILAAAASDGQRTLV